jgi:hypothetical protein
VTPPSIPAGRPYWPLPVYLAAAGALLLTGCDKPATITKYETPRVEPRAAPIDAAEQRMRLDHMFAAIVPTPGQAWFFKLVVPATAADDVREPFEDFVATINAEPGGKLPQWTLPEGWTAAEGGNAMRAATITIPHGDDNYDITVSVLPQVGPWPAFLKENVDRWMEQLQQPKLDAATINKLARTLPTKGEDATAFELVGTMQRNLMGLGAGGMPAEHPPIAASPPLETAPSATTPPTEDVASPPPSTDDGFKYELPAGWSQGRPSSMRKASFVVAGPDGQAEGGVFVFPPVRDMVDPQANAERWASMVGIAQLTPEEMKAAESKIDFGGEAGTRFEFYSPADAPRAQGILAALAVHDNQVWSVRLSGDRAVVESQREAFDQFIASIRLP